MKSEAYARSGDHKEWIGVWSPGFWRSLLVLKGLLITMLVVILAWMGSITFLMKSHQYVFRKDVKQLTQFIPFVHRRR